MRMLSNASCALLLFVGLVSRVVGAETREEWLQFQFDPRHSGNLPDRSITTPLELVGAVPLTDAIFTAPVVADGCVYIVDGGGVAVCIDAHTLQVRWTFHSRGGPANCNNVSSPAVVGPYLHFGTTAGWYYVLDRRTGAVVKEIACGEPVLSAPVSANGRAYFATLGARIFAVEPDGTPCWTWDFVREVLGFNGDRWNGQEWLEYKHGRATWRDHFCCSRNIVLSGNTLIIPAGGRTVFLEDVGKTPRVRTVAEIPSYAGREYAATFGQSVGEDGEVYVQWHRRDNAGRVEIFRLHGDQVEAGFFPSTQTAINLPGLLSFSPVSVRGRNVYRCRPEKGYGLCKHVPDKETVQPLASAPAIAPAVLLRDVAVYGGLDGRIHVVSLSGQGERWSFATPFGKTISAPVAVCQGRIYAGCEDGYLYVLGHKDRAATSSTKSVSKVPLKDLGLERIRSPLRSLLRDAKYDWFTNYGNFSNTNVNAQGIRPPLKIKWVRRYAGTFKHLPVCGGGRVYTHTAEGQILALEQETGRLLWRRYWPGVYLSFTAPTYWRERLFLPQAGMHSSRMRCLDAATGKLLWEAPFTGSPSWSRQSGPVVYKNLVVYASGSGRYAAQGTEKAFVMKGEPQPAPDGAELMSWIYSHNNPYYPKDNRPLIWAWDIRTGELVWRKDFSEYGFGGNDCGLCLMDGKLYYSTFFGYSAKQRQRRGQPVEPNGLTTCLDPRTGESVWLTTEYSVTAGCTISAKDGRLYLGGYNAPNEQTSDRYVFCLDAKDGALIWRSEPVRSAVNVVAIGRDFLFSNASGRDGHVMDPSTGRIRSRFNLGYACTRFTVSEPYVLGANMDMIDLSHGNALVSTGPSVDSRECVGATVSNGRVFYTSQASGLQLGLVAGAEAERLSAAWESEHQTK